jgi:hypothetical protein
MIGSKLIPNLVGQITPNLVDQITPTNLEKNLSSKVQGGQHADCGQNDQYG